MKKESEARLKMSKRKNEFYFPLEANIATDGNVAELLLKYGPKGFGIYIMILTELRQCVDYRYSLNAVKKLAQRCGISIKSLNRVIHEFNLFELAEVDGTTYISSLYLNRVMSAYEEKHRRLSEAAVKRNNKFNRDENGQFTDTIGALEEKRGEEKREEENISSTTIISEDEQETNSYKTWEECLDTAVKDESWMEILAMNSGISKLFMKHRATVIEAFRQHVHLQGGRTNIRTEQEIKAYFANFLRPGTPTQKRMAGLLTAREEELKQTSDNRYETIDPETGERSYFGNPIPPDAPPRPNDNAVWSKQLNQWML